MRAVVAARLVDVRRRVGARRAEVQPPAAPPRRVRCSRRRLGERRVLDQEGGRRPAGADVRMAHEPAQERQVRRHALDLGVREGCGERVERLVAGVPVRDELGDHRVVADRDLVALLDARVDADPGRKPKAVDPAGLREERARILGVEPHLDGVAEQETVLLASSGSPPAIRSCSCDEVDAGHELRDGVLDLDPPVQLEEPEVATVEHELGRAGAAVADRPRERDGGLAHARAQRRIERGEGASSSTFWCRRCTEHSRSPRGTTLPCASARSWISTCRGRST